MTFLPDYPLTISPALVFGLLLLAGSLGGYLAHRLRWLPSITGFMALGLAIGPYGLGLLSHEVINGSKIFVDVALALILYRLGLSLDIRKILHCPKILVLSLVESAVTFSVVGALMWLLGLAPVIAALVATIAVSSSPAVLLHVAHEVGAAGPVTTTTKTIVALNNVWSFALFSIITPYLLFRSGSDWQEILLRPSYGLLGSLALGMLLAAGLHQMTKRLASASQYQLAIVIGAIMLALGLATALKLSLLIIPLVMGTVIASIEHENSVSNIDFGSTFELFFIVLFVYAGANLHLSELLHFGPVVLVMVLGRSLMKVLCATGVSKLQGLSFKQGLSTGLLLIPMAGLAIGLSQTIQDNYPSYADTVVAIVLGAVAIFETLGPPIAKLAFRICGEALPAEKQPG